MDQPSALSSQQESVNSTMNAPTNAKTFTPRDMLAKLVGFPTVSHESNLDLIHFVKDYLAGHSIESHLVYNEDKRKANLWATLGPKVEGGIIFSGHTDVVPVEGQNWTTDPFTLTQKGENLYGRGTCDMKGYLATALALLPQMLAADLKKPLTFALSYDEEPGCLGAPSMIEDINKKTPKHAICLVGEPSMMKVVTQHKGFLGLETRVRGVEVHSSQFPRGVNANHWAARLMCFLDDMMSKNRALAEKSGTQSPFEPPYTTLNCGLLKGGTAQNITAKDCFFTTDIRNIPTDDVKSFEARYRAFIASEIEPKMKAIHPDAGVTVGYFTNIPPLCAENQGAAEELARRLTGDNGLNVVPYGSEAGQFQETGISTVICGPGDISQAHQPDEFVSIDQIDQCERFIKRVIEFAST